MDVSVPRLYSSDLTDVQWALVAPMVPVKTGGRPAINSRRRIVDAILYVDRTGCAWRMMPHDFLVVGHRVLIFLALGRRRHHRPDLRDARCGPGCRRTGPEGHVLASWMPSRAGVPTRRPGNPAVTTRDRRPMAASATSKVDSAGMQLMILATSASLQDRAGDRYVLERARMAMPSVAQIWADGGHAGKLVNFARQRLHLNLVIVRKPKGQHVFEALLQSAGGGTRPVLAGTLPPPQPRLGTASLPRRSDGQMGNDRAHGPAPDNGALSTSIHVLR